jgi:uncharacterized ubiquitin-like protein YukD
MLGTAEHGQKTVTVRVQVIDLKSFTLDLQVPNYLPARDLTQRIARDAGLEAHWPDGRRRLYWIRARGRLVADEETLAALGVVDGELVYLLPEPPAGSGVKEQVPDYPENRGYSAQGTVKLLTSMGGLVLWAAAWGIALVELRNGWTVMIPGMALGLMCTSFARHAWGGLGSSPRVALTAVVVLLPMLGLTLAMVVGMGGVGLKAALGEVGPGILMAMVGVMCGWLAWWGAVEPLAPLTPGNANQSDDSEAMAIVTCGICGQGVKSDVRAECAYRCGRYFHTGCMRARQSVYTGDPSHCALCNVRIA